MSRVGLFNRTDPKVQAMAGVVQRMLDGAGTPVQKHQILAEEIIKPILVDRIVLEDLWGPILGEENWVGVPLNQRKFKVPTEIIGATEVLTYRNGVTFPQFTFQERYVTVTDEELAVPEWVVDQREIQRTDPLATVEDAVAAITKMILIEKARRGYYLLTQGFDDPATNLKVIIDDGTFTPTDQKTYLRTLRETLEEGIESLQDSFGGRPQLQLVARQITLDGLKRSGLSADWDSFMRRDGGPGPDRQDFKPALNPSLQVFAFPAVTDDINGFANRGRQIITQGDLLMIGPNAAQVAQTEELESSVIQKAHFVSGYAYRTAYSWVRWSNLGDKNKIFRVLVIKTVASGAPQGVLTIDSLTADGVRFYSTRPLKKSTITNTTLKVSATAGGAVATGALTVELKGDLRHGIARFGTPLTPGTTYFVSGTAGIQDLANEAVAVLAEIQLRCA